MKISQQIISLILIGALLMTCFPLGNMEDISQDGKVDLQDVILVVKGVARTVETSESIKKCVGRAVAVISVAAGLKTIIKSSKDISLSKTTSINDFLFLVSSNQVEIFCNNSLIIDETSIQFKSIEFPPISPPPQKMS